MTTTTPEPLIDWRSSPWPVPSGWTYVYAEGMHCIEREVGPFKLSICDDDGQWVWWLCPQNDPLGCQRGEGHDVLDAMWRCFDALATALEAASSHHTNNPCLN
jgi:hypothetical protein